MYRILPLAVFYKFVWRERYLGIVRHKLLLHVKTPIINFFNTIIFPMSLGITFIFDFVKTHTKVSNKLKRLDRKIPIIARKK